MIPTIRKLLVSFLRITLMTAVFLALIVSAVWIAVRQPDFGRPAFPESPRADAKILRRHVAFLTHDVFPRNLHHLDNLNKAADYIRAKLRMHGAVVSEETYTADGIRCRNIIGRFGPPSGRLIVVGAHYDVYGDFPGADDNASGVAGLLELARLLNGRVLSLPVELVAFSTEEPPYFGGDQMGSAVHARALRAAGVQMNAMLSLEMIGFFAEKQRDHNVLLRVIYPQTGDFVMVAGRWEDRVLAREVKKSMRGPAGPPVFSYSGPIVIGADLSDHQSFWKEGYPGVMITDTAFLRNPHYHTADDRVETLDYGRMANIVDGVFNVVLRLQSGSRD